MSVCSTLTMCSYEKLFSGKNAHTSVNSILPGELAEVLQTTSTGKQENYKKTKNNVDPDSLMLLDCRSFLAYNFKHIAGALNVNCTGIGRKRLQQGKASLVDLITSEYGKELLKSGRWAKAVVYDESTSELEKAPASHPIKLVLAALLSQGKEAFLLKGGMKEFSLCYQNLLSVRHNECVEDVTNAIDRINCLAKYQQNVNVDQSCPLNVRATEVIPELFLGNAADARDKSFLDRHNVQFVLNLTTNCPNHYISNDKFRYKQIKIEDSCREDIKPIIEEAIEFIDLAKSNHSSVLVHCQGGVSRSPTITIAYLMHTNKLSLTEAYDFVKRKRPCIAPNLNFMGQLLDMEEKHHYSTLDGTQSDLVKKFNFSSPKE